MSNLRPQRYGRRIAMSEPERDAFLARERVCRIATGGPSGPHATPLWFVWDGSALWLNSLVRSRRWADLGADPRVAAVIDGGERYEELHGVEIRGRVTPVGELPRTGSAGFPELGPVERAFAAKYFGEGSAFRYDGRHGWLRLDPEKIVSWDFRKIGGAAG